MLKNTRKTDQAVLEINIKNLQNNYLKIKSLSPDSAVSAVVKSDAYGLGAIPVSEALYQVGARIFFVATTCEAISLYPALKKIGDDFHIAILGGIFPEFQELYQNPHFRPVLNTPDQIVLWRDWGHPQAAYIHVDTGMNRLGLRPEEFVDIQNNIQFPIAAVLSHLLNADNINDQTSEIQRKKISEFSKYPLSLANSAGCFCGEDYAFDLRRPGIALYGGNPIIGRNDISLDTVVKLKAKVLQHRKVYHDETVGYAHGYYALQDSHIATIAIGYNDGIPRSLQSQKFFAYAGDTPLEIVGRISMDTLAVLNSKCLDFDEVYLLNDHQGIDQLAQACHTIGHEVLTGLGSRIHRQYL